MTSTLKIVPMTYPRELELGWKQSCGMLVSSGACQFLKDILGGKVARRGGATRRFFGEAYVATRVHHVEGYYGSFQWLTSPAFLGNRPFPAGPTQAFQTEYRSALSRHFGDDIKRLQQNAATLESRTGITPAAPDLWLVDAGRNHRFIEVKLPKDEVSLSQIAGLAVIASSFRRPNLSVEVVELNPDREGEFREFIEQVDKDG